MEAIGELFGRSVDDVLAHLWVAIAPLAFNLVAVLAGVGAFALLAGAPLPLPAAPGGGLEVRVPGGLPSVNEVYDVLPVAAARGPRAFAAVGAFLLALVPVAAYAEGAFIELLARLPPRPREGDPRPPQAPPVGEPVARASAAMDAFDAAGRRHFLPLLIYRGLLGALLISVLAVQAWTPLLGDHAVAGLAVEFLLIFAPYAIVLEGRGPVDAMAASVRLIADHPAPTLVMLLFGLLTTGGMAALVAPLIAGAGAAGLAAAALLYAPVGSALSLFVLRVYLQLRPRAAGAELADEWAARRATPGQ